MVAISVRESKRKAIGLSVLSIFMLCLCLFDLIVGAISRNYLYIGIGIVGTTFFGFCAIFIIKRNYKTVLSDTGVEILKVDDEGIHDMSTAISTGLIRWEEVKSVRIVRMLTQRFIGIEVNDLDAYLSRISPAQRKAAKANMMMSYPPINITLNTSKMKIEKVVEDIKRRLEENNQNY